MSKIIPKITIDGREDKTVVEKVTLVHGAVRSGAEKGQSIAER